MGVPETSVAPSLAGKYAARTEDGLERVISLILAAIAYRDREEPHSSPLPHHPAYGSVPGDSADQAESDPRKQNNE